jgi:hypothetical protein
VGTIVAEPTDKQSRIGLELGGLLDKGPPLVSVNNQQLNVGPAASGSLVDVQKAVHQILSGGGLPELPALSPPASAAAPPVVEGTLVPVDPRQS